MMRLVMGSRSFRFAAVTGALPSGLQRHDAIHSACITAGVSHISYLCCFLFPPIPRGTNEERQPRR